MSAWLARFRCENCAAQYASALPHPTLGAVCPICLHPVPAAGLRSKRRRGRGGGHKLRTVAVRDLWQCHLCRGPVEPRGKGVSAPTVDHLVPVSLGGSNALENLKLAHAGCNHKRGNAPLEATNHKEK